MKDKKSLKERFKLFNRHRYEWDVKKERERDRRIIDSFNFAIEGLTAAIRNEKHMKVHIIASIIIIISLSVSFVIITELMNTSVEALVDMVSPERHPLAKLAKDVAAGAVLVAAINALCVGYLLFYDKLLDIFDSKDMLHTIAARKGNVSILIIILVAILVIIIKSLFNKGTPLEGGMPSGHSAIAFAVFGILLYMTSDIRILGLAFFMALLVAQSRVKAGIHSFKEVLAGGFLGFVVATSIMFFLASFGILYN